MLSVGQKTGTPFVSPEYPRIGRTEGPALGKLQTKRAGAALRCHGLSVPLHTLGYEGCSIAEVLAALETYRIGVVIDVRDVPVSRKPGFSKSALSAHLAEKGISYVHLKSLGDPKMGRIAAREGRYRDFRRIFLSHLITEAAQKDLQRGIEAASRERACLLCFERNHAVCHRSIVAERMRETGIFQVLHIDVKDVLANVPRKAQRRIHDRGPVFIL